MCQGTLFDVTRRCRGCTSAECLDDGRHKCLDCGRVFNGYRHGYCNCGVTEELFWQCLVDQVVPCGIGEYEVPEGGVVIKEQQ